MNVTIMQFKLDLIDRLKERGIYWHKVSDVQYKTRCPYCGDSDDPSHGHFYMYINPKNDSAIKYYCFRCPAGGYLNIETLERLGVSDLNLKGSLDYVRSHSVYDKKDINSNEWESKTYFWKMPDINRKNHRHKITYLENRLGVKLDNETLNQLKVVVSIKDFLKLNEIKKITCEKQQALDFEDDYIGFLSSSGSHLILRDTSDSHKFRWYKYKILKDIESGNLMYFIPTEIHPLETNDVYVNISEGIIDTCSIYLNDMNEKGKDIIQLNLTTLGKYHLSVVKWLVGLGIFGSNVHITIWANADFRYDKKKTDTTLEYYENLFKYHKLLFGTFDVCYNLLDNDFGVPKEKVVIDRHRI